MRKKITRPLPYLTLSLISVFLAFSLFHSPMDARSGVTESPSDDETPPFVSTILTTNTSYQLASADNRVSVTFSPNTFPEEAEVRLYSLDAPYGLRDWRQWLSGFLLHAQQPYNENGNVFDSLNSPANVSLTYTDTSLSAEDEALLKLFFWDEEQQRWVDATTTCSSGGAQQLDVQANQLSATVCKTGEFGLLVDKPPQLTYLPMVSNGNGESSTAQGVLNFSPLAADGITALSDNCTQILINPNFEKNSGWRIHGSSRPAIYTTARSLNGVRSMRTGIMDAAYNNYSFSVFSQDVSIPSDATSVTLTFYLYQRSTESSATSSAGVSLQEPQTINANTKDVNYVGLYDLNDKLIADPLVWERSNARVWTGYAFDLLGFKGRWIRLKFGTYNDGLDGVTGMYVDSATLVVCKAAAPVSLIKNGGFENSGGWTRLSTPIIPVYTTAKAHSGNRSMLVGVTQDGSTAKGFSMFEQMVTIPITATNPTLQFYWWGQSGEENLNNLPAQQLSDASLALTEANDVQYVAIMDLNHNVLAYPLWRRSNDRTWQVANYDMTPYIGKTIVLRFGVYNDGDGNVTAMYVDDVSISLP
ncbi:MAG: hypothetical protein ACPL3P_00225 [Anaerolineales bacterium]